MNHVLRFVVGGLIVGTAMVGCGTAKKRERPPVPPMQDVAAPPPKDSHIEDVKKSAAEQLECPIEEVNVTCVRRDSMGECVSVRADGCGKTFEYQFGDV